MLHREPLALNTDVAGPWASGAAPTLARNGRGVKMVQIYRKFLDSAVRKWRSGQSASERSEFWYGISIEEPEPPMPEIDQIRRPGDFEDTGRGRETGT